MKSPAIFRVVSRTRFLSLFCGLFYFVFCAQLLFAQESTFVYAEGEVDLRDTAGELWFVEIGDYIQAGETVITGVDGFAEIEKPDFNILKVAPKTVFTFLESEINGEKQSVLSCTLGSVAFKIDKVVGEKAYVATGSMVAGVRGTVFTVFAGTDGSSLLVVEEGEVDVTSEGKTVVVFPEEGVEVQPGEPPGEKFPVLRGQMDYSAWNAEKEKDFRRNPVEAVLRAERRMGYFQEKIEEILPVLEDNRDRLIREREKLEAIEKEKGKEERAQYYQDTVFPLEVETGYLSLNVRYYALSSLSFRRYVLGRMYLLVRSAHFEDPADPEYNEFKKIYDRTLDKFEKNIVPHLVEADI